jgi:hypothetical protein
MQMSFIGIVVANQHVTVKDIAVGPVTPLFSSTFP